MRDTLFTLGLLLITSLFTFSTSAASSPQDPPLFSSCEDIQEVDELQGTLCARLNVPLKWAAKNEQQIALFVRKFPAKQTREGTVWLIAGGPGESGASFYRQIDIFQDAFPQFDLMVPDHRGTGYSSTICPQESPDSVGGTTLVGEEWGGCFGHMYANTDYVKAFSITHAAMDLAHLINTQSGDGKRYVYGVSYGTQLTLRLLQLKDVHLDGVILDSLVPMQDDARFDLSQRSRVVNEVGLAVLKRCDAAQDCAGHEPLATVLTRVLKNRPLLSDFADDLPKASLSNTLGILLDIPHLRARLPALILALDKGDAQPLKSVIGEVESFYAGFNPGYKNFGSSIPLVQVISSSENNLRPALSKEQVAKESGDLLFTSPLPGLLAGNSMPTYEKDAFFAALPKTLPPVMVLQGSLDPKTPYQGALDHVNTLRSGGEVNMVQVVDAPHFVSLYAPMCFKDAVAAFLSDKQRPGTTCQSANVRL